MKSHKRDRRYWFKLLRLFLISIIPVIIGMPCILAAVPMLVLTRPQCNPGGTPADYGLSYEGVTFPTSDGLMQRGYFVAGDNGATMIIVPAYNNGRGAELQHAVIYHDASFNVLTIESRVCIGASTHSIGYKEVDDVEAAYAYLTTRTDVDPIRVGLQGFSSGGATSIMAVARILQIQAVTAMGGYHDFKTLLEPGDNALYLPQVFKFGARLGYRLSTGQDLNDLNPLAALDSFGTRKLLLVYGSREVSLPGARTMLARAQELGVDAQLWIVDGANHGTYLSVAPEEFASRVMAFNRAVLLGDAG